MQITFGNRLVKNSQVNNDTSVANPISQKETLDLNGEIEPSSQNENIMDCWLLSVLNSLSYSKTGKEKIKNLFEFEKDQTTVNLYNNEVEIDNDDILNAKIKGLYSSGDDDVKAIEIAMEKTLDEYNDGDVDLIDKRLRFKNEFGNDKSSLNKGYTHIAYYLLTGKIAKFITSETKEEKLDELIEKFRENDGENLFIVCSNLDSTKSIKDIEGNNIKLYKNHTYSIKEVKEKSVVLYDSIDNTDLEIPLEALKENFDSFEYDFLQ